MILMLLLLHHLALLYRQYCFHNLVYDLASYHEQDNEQYEESSNVNRVIPNDAKVKSLNSLGATFNFIYIWLHLLRENYFA